jgi:hypothetical protein
VTTPVTLLLLAAAAALLRTVIQYSTAVRNAKLDAIETTIGTSPKLQVRTGGPPANCAAAATGTLLCEIALPSDWMGAASGGTKAKAGAWTGTAVSTGVAGHFRILDSSGTTCHAQGTVTLTGGGGDMTMDNTNLASSQAVTINTGTITDNNG